MKKKIKVSFEVNFALAKTVMLLPFLFVIGSFGYISLVSFFVHEPNFLFALGVMLFVLTNIISYGWFLALQHEHDLRRFICLAVICLSYLFAFLFLDLKFEAVVLYFCNFLFYYFICFVDTIIEKSPVVE